MFDSSKFTKSLEECKANKFKKPDQTRRSNPLAIALLGGLIGFILTALINFSLFRQVYNQAQKAGKKITLEQVQEDVSRNSWGGVVLGFLVFGFFGVIRSALESKISGVILITQSELQQELTPNPKLLPSSPLNLGGVKLPTSAEQFPLLILGSDEVGKSVLMINLLKALIHRGQQWQTIVIYQHEESYNIDFSDLMELISEFSVVINAVEIAAGNLTTMSTAQLALSNSTNSEWVLMPFSEALSNQYSQAYELGLETLNQALSTSEGSDHKKIALVLKGTELLDMPPLQSIIAQVQRLEGLVIVASESIAPLARLFYPRAWNGFQAATKVILNYQDASTIEKLCRTIGIQHYRERVVTRHDIYYRGHYGVASSVKYNHHTRYAIAPDQLRSLRPRQAYLKVGELNPTGIGF